MVHWWAADLWNRDPVALIAWTFWCFFSVTLHELGHGWAAIRRGDDTPIHTGHMTWNPIVHTGMGGLLLFAFTSMIYGLMPVDPSRMRGRYADAYVSFAGPVMNLSLAFVCLIVGALWIKFGGRIAGDPILGNVMTFLEIGLGLNATLFLLNLMPVPPLDGSRILADFWRPFREFLETDPGKMLQFVGFIVLLLFFSRHIASFAIDTATDLLVFTVRLMG
ncbi:MAG: site-2 protease family protein [Planctomycetota bacterium]